MRRLLILLTSIFMMALMTNCEGNKSAIETQQEDVKVYDPQKMLIQPVWRKSILKSFARCCRTRKYS